MKVLDYKSGNTVFDLVKLYYGTQLQLAVYMDAVMEQKKAAQKQVSVEPGSADGAVFIGVGSIFGGEGNGLSVIANS